jgi:hypothetical protein
MEANAPALALAGEAFRGLARAGHGCDCPVTALRVCPKPYRNARLDVLIGLAPEQDQCACYPSEDWFLIRAGKALHFRSIYGAEDSLHLIDTGDYDGDDVSEALFLEEGVGDGRDALVLLRAASATVFTLPGPYSF